MSNKTLVYTLAKRWMRSSMYCLLKSMKFLWQNDKKLDKTVKNPCTALFISYLQIEQWSAISPSAIPTIRNINVMVEACYYLLTV